MANSSFVMIKQETRWGYIPPQQQPVQQYPVMQQPVISQQYGNGNTTNIFNAPVTINQPVQQYSAMQQPMQQQPIISQQYGNGNTTNIFNNYIAPVAMNQPAQQYPAMQQPMQQQPIISQQYGNGNTTNIFNNYIEQQPMIQQPNLMTPQVPTFGTQQPTQIVFVPANLGTTQPAPTAPATSSNDSAMKFMLMMMTMLLGSLNKKEAADKDDIEEENIETTDPKKTGKPVGQSKTDNLDGKEVDGTIYYTASNLNKTVSDPDGNTTTKIGGSNNSITFSGNKGDNTYIIDGKSNDILIKDIESGDKIVLEGDKKDWEVIGEAVNHGKAFKSDTYGEITYKNKKTGTVVKVRTEATHGRLSTRYDAYTLAKRTEFTDGSNALSVYNDYVNSKK